MMNKIRLSKSSMSSLEKTAVVDVLDKEYLGMGAETQKFEMEVASFLEVDSDYVAAVNSGTSALHIALAAIGVKPGDEVIVPSLTYVASFQAISACGAIPVACEVNPDTLFLDAEDAKSRITANTKAIMPVHYASSSLGISQVYDLAREYNLRVIEDAAQAFGCYSLGKKVGSTGDVICFSFDGIKNITCGEGGAVVAFDAKTINNIKDMRLLGVKKDTEQRYAGQRSWDFDVELPGFRYHMSNINAAIGLAQLSRIDEFTANRQAISNKYLSALKNVSEMIPLKLDYENTVSHIFVVLVERRDELRNFLLAKNIEVGIHYKPNHLLSKFSTGASLPLTEAIYEQLLTLPIHNDLTDEEQDYVIDSIYEFFN
ncbi:DegT/DnrJ/EryC1/StrS family aminotransferase [Vibrio nomapromontoriensis]|uniref:DegT/DnrJ/EryC1/StrS family aminotransferase n=1 Tax=Vibrio nomapromontoriensis TaxID=2910246 RepID=UPI003D139833